MSHEAKLWTTGQIAKHLRTGLHQVEYVLKSRKITPIGRAGNARVFSDEAVEWGSETLSEISRKRGSDQGGNEVSA